MIVPEGMISFARKALELSQATNVELIPFAGRGSDRSYYRLKWDGDQSAIFVHYNPERKENAFFVDIARFLESIDIPTAEILGHEPSNCFIVMQDLGNIDLWQRRQAPREKRRVLYQKTLFAIHRLHNFPAHRFPADRVHLTESFGPALYRWERNYFLENFVGKACGIYPEPGFLEALEAELTALADRLSSGRQCLIHRDLQSQNVMVLDDEPYFIDFQGMRFGTHFYDLGSLLYDPYVAFTETEREELLLFYYGISKDKTDPDAFRLSFHEASTQRLMQALGAYGFLGIIKGLKDYLVHVRPGLENLAFACRNAGTLPCLQEIASRCMETLSNNNRRIDI